MAMSLAGAVNEERRNQLINLENNPLVPLLDIMGQRADEAREIRLREQERAAEMEALFKLEERKEDIRRKRAEESRKQAIELELAKIGIDPTVNRQESGEVQRITSDDAGAIHKRGIDSVTEPNIIPRNRSALSLLAGRNKELMTKGIYSVDPITGELKKSGTVPRRSEVFKGVMSPEQVQQRAVQKGRANAVIKDIEMTAKLTGAVKKLAILNKQYQKALPSGDRTPLEQRIVGGLSSWAAEKGLIDNPELVALRRNIRPIAINVIRLFGEVGNLSESEQQGAIDVVDQADITDEERIASTRQFIEYALAGASEEGINFISEREDIGGVLDAFGVNLDQEFDMIGNDNVSSSVDIQSGGDFTEEDIIFTMQKHGLSREEVLKRIGAQ